MKAANRKPRRKKPDAVIWKEPITDSTGCEVRVSMDGTFRIVRQDQAYGVAMPLRWTIWQESQGKWRKIYDGGRSERKALEFVAERKQALDENEDEE